jgi:cytochrome c oxidase cbb3-type subunit 3
MSEFWSGWIIVLTIVTIVLLLWLLFATRKIKIDRDDNTTGHVYDGIVEEDNPLPGWWFSMFVISIIFGVGYLIVYPGLGNYPGLLGWTSAGEHDRKKAEVDAAFAQSTLSLAGLSINEIMADPKAVKMGRRLYVNTCSGCHGSDGKGSFGFPNLTDAHWQWGGSDEQLLHSITHGRTASMPAWKDVLTDVQTDNVVDYVLALGGGNVSDTNKGQAVFASYCQVCHQADGSGNQLLGAPSLVDTVWLYGGSKSQVLTSIAGGRNGQMPNHSGLLGEQKIRLLAAYIRSLAAE